MSPKLYILRGSPPVRAVLVTAEALGIKLSLHEVDYGNLSSHFSEISSHQPVPVMDDNGFVIWNSHAINAYLVEKYGKNDSLYPEDFQQRSVVNQRLHFDTGVLFSLLSSIVISLSEGKITSIPLKKIEVIRKRYRFLETFLEGRQWIAGDSVTIADFSLVTTATSLDVFVEIDPQMFPNITNWIKRSYALPYFAVEQEELQIFKKYFQNFLS